MSVNAVSQTSNNLCPHGLPPGACPACSGGGGGHKKLHSNPVKKSNQWSYAKCYSVWQSMKAQKAAAEQKALNEARQLETAKALQTKLNKIMTKFQNLATTLTNMLPEGVRATFAKVFNSVITPMMNLINKLPQLGENIKNFLNDIKAQILSVSEKLTAIYGEIKNFVERKIAQRYKKLTKSLIKLFVFNLEDENYSDDEELRIFKSRELRKIRHAVMSVTKESESSNENSPKTHK
ncbi:hypothetical protein IKQ26_07750 [bacterium]|nr:hypothetical protein [bacterium]